MIKILKVNDEIKLNFEEKRIDENGNEVWDIPTDLEEFTLKGPIWIAKALVDTKLESSTSQARRDVKQGAVKIDQVKIEDEQLQLQSGEYVLQVGKRKFAKVKVS